jgi:hypothetical protein
VLGDPDFAIYVEAEDSFWTGVPVGYGAPLPRVPAVFPKKEKSRPLDDSEFSSMANSKQLQVGAGNGRRLGE